ncbi:unnamed protein product [Moneuplotes crassus]|uniref:Uncharacterized protein n=1 Tax=Euplotes crassus TaxID=5936 RepID=A0AAD1XAB5_EUPCR|nr:unnamed protein product [Moneuplotes crassus]
MKCERQRNNSVKKSGNKNITINPSNRESIMKGFNYEVALESAKKSSTNEYHSKTVEFNINIFNKKAKKDVYKNSKKFKAQTLKKMSDCKIFFPSKGLIGKVESKYKEKPQFVIIPKEKYLRMQSGTNFDNTTTLRSSPFMRKSRKNAMNNYKSNRSLINYSSPPRQPKKKLFQSRRLRKSTDYRRPRISANTSSCMLKPSKFKNLSRPRTGILKKRKALEPLVRYKASKMPKAKFKKPYIRVNASIEYPTETSMNIQAFRKKSLKSTNKMEERSWIDELHTHSRININNI